MQSAAPWRRRTSNTSSWSHDGSRSSTAQRIVSRVRCRGTRRAGRRCASIAAGAARAWDRDGRPAARPGRGGWGASRGVAQLHAVRAECAELDGEHEAGAGGSRPALDGRCPGQPVEGRVELDRVEQLLVVVEPQPLRELGRVHHPAPVLVRPPRTADAQRRSHRADQRWASRRSSTSAARISAARSSARSTADGWYVTRVGRPWTRNRSPRLAAIAVVRPNSERAAVAPSTTTTDGRTARSSASIHG